MKKGTKKFLFLSVATLAGMYAYNQFVASTSTKKNMLPTKNGSYYSWKQGNVFYTKTGTGDQRIAGQPVIQNTPGSESNRGCFSV